MRGILAGGLALIAALMGGTMAYVYREADLSYHAAVARCLDAGGGWVPRSAHSFAGTCRVQNGGRG